MGRIRKGDTTQQETLERVRWGWVAWWWCIIHNDVLPLPGGGSSIFSLNRVVSNRRGYVVTLGEAMRDGLRVDVVFVRDDGWCLGAPDKFADVAQRMWRGSWVAVLRCDNE